MYKDQGPETKIVVKAQQAQQLKDRSIDTLLWLLGGEAGYKLIWHIQPNIRDTYHL
jgi:hypothetical protein